MNVGSILNNDSPPGDGESVDVPQRPQASPSQQRHSLVNLLNDPAPSGPTKSSDVESNSNEVKSPVSTSDGNSADYKVPKQVTSSPVTVSRMAPLMKRNSIANITNDRDVDINTGQETLNVSRQSSISEPHPTSALEDLSLISVHEENGIIHGKKGSLKPKRYETPPIWAQLWRPRAEQHTYGYEERNISSGSMNNASAIPTSQLSNKSVFNNSHTESVDLECSITGVIPPPSVTRTIAEWIYANFTEIPDDRRKYVELELKFGTIIDKRASHRIDLNVLTECIFTDTSNTYFDVGVHEVGWNDMCKFLDDLEKSYQEDLRKNPQLAREKPKRKFNNLESDITDTFYQIIQRNEQPKTIRISKDNQLKPPRYTAINKQRISDLFIHNPSSMYDLRLSLSSENPIPDSDIELILKKQPPTLTRVKKRNSWSHKPTVTRFDMTRVLVPRELKNKSGKKIIEQDQSYEVELEVDTFELFNGFDMFKSGLDSIRFEELVEIFVNNARCLNNRVTKLASK